MAINLSSLFPSGTVTANYQFAQNQTYIIDQEFTLSGENTFKPKSVIRISLCHTAPRNPNDRFGFNKYFLN